MTLHALLTGISAFAGIIILILDGKTAINGALEGIYLCIQTIVPALFPFFLFTNILTGSFVGMPIPLLRPLGKWFQLPRNAESVLIAAFLGGYPVGAQAVAVAWKNDQLSRKDAERMLSFCSNAGPSFLFGILSFMFPDPWYPWILWGIQIFSAWMVSQLISGSEIPAKVGKSGISPVTAMSSAVKTMGCVCGWVILFRVVLTFLERWFFWMLPEVCQVVLTGILELSNGCCSLHFIESIPLRFVICSGILSLGGICVSMQTASVIQGLSMRYYFTGKVMQCFFSIILSICILQKCYWLPVLILIYFGFIYGKKKNSGSNPQKAVV